MPTIAGWYVPTDPDAELVINDRLYKLTTHWLELERNPARCLGLGCVLCECGHPIRTELILPVRRPESTIVGLLRIPKALHHDSQITAIAAAGPSADGLSIALCHWFDAPKITVMSTPPQTIPHSRCDRYIAAIGVALYARLASELRK